MATGFEKVARRISLLGSFIWAGVFLQAFLVGLKNLRIQPGFHGILWSKWVAPFGFAIFIVVMKLLWRPLPWQPPLRWRNLLAANGLVTFTLGWLLSIWGRKALGRMFGLSTAIEAPLHKNHKLVTTGPYSLVRHPIYLGDFLMALGLLAIWRNWAAALVSSMAPNLIFRALREEATLARQFGRQWEAYAARVPILLPGPSQISLMLVTVWRRLSWLKFLPKARSPKREVQ